jgi:dihydrofolate reductase/thymidylate synthase
MSKLLNLIVCKTYKNGIGLNNKLPWNLSKELLHFKKITATTEKPELKNAVIMGKNTWESLPDKSKPLKDRLNVVLTTKKNKFKNYEKCDYITNSIEDSIKYLTELEEIQRIFVIGGESVYNQVINEYTDLIDKMYITEIYENLKCDTYFPEFDNNKFKLMKISKFNEENNHNFRYLVYQNHKYIPNKKSIVIENNIYNQNIISNTKPINTNHFMGQYWTNQEELQTTYLLNNILENGVETESRNSKTLSLFSPNNLHYNLEDTLPVDTIKKSFIRGIFEELMFVLRGQTDNKILQDKNVHVWDGNTTREFLDSRNLQHFAEGDLGATYGFNLKNFGAKYYNCKTDYSKNPNNKGFNQLASVINLIKNEPSSRRIIINLFDPTQLENCSLPPCLMLYQFNVDIKRKKLNLMIFNRSSDVFLASKWNCTHGAILVHLICSLEGINLTPGSLTHNFGDAHIYSNQIDAVKKYVKKEPLPYPKLKIKNKKKKITDFEFSDLQLIAYKSHPNDPDLKVDMVA